MIENSLSPHITLKNRAFITAPVRRFRDASGPDECSRQQMLWTLTVSETKGGNFQSPIAIALFSLYVSRAFGLSATGPLFGAVWSSFIYMYAIRP